MTPIMHFSSGAEVQKLHLSDASGLRTPSAGFIAPTAVLHKWVEHFHGSGVSVLYAMVPSSDERVGCSDGMRSAAMPPECMGIPTATTRCKGGDCWTCAKAKEELPDVKAMVLESGRIGYCMYCVGRLKSGLNNATFSLKSGEIDFIVQPIMIATATVANAFPSQTHPSGVDKCERHEYVGEALAIRRNPFSSMDTLLQTMYCERQSALLESGCMGRIAVLYEPPDAYDGHMKLRSTLRRTSRKQGARGLIVSRKARNRQRNTLFTFAVWLRRGPLWVISSHFVVLCDRPVPAPIGPEECVAVIIRYNAHAVNLSFPTLEHLTPEGYDSSRTQATTAVILEDTREKAQRHGSVRAASELATAATLYILERAIDTQTRRDRSFCVRHIRDTEVARDVVLEWHAPHNVMSTNKHDIDANVVMPRDILKQLHGKQRENIIGLWLAGDPLRPALHECLSAVYRASYIQSSCVSMHAILALCKDAMRRPNYWRHEVIDALPLPRAKSCREFGAQHLFESFECLRQLAPKDVGDLLLCPVLEESQAVKPRLMLQKAPSTESLPWRRLLEDRNLPGLAASRSERTSSPKILQRPCRRRRVSHALVQFARQEFSKEQHRRGRDYAAPKSPSPPDLVAETLSQLHWTGKLQRNTLVADLGCGDARWLVAACSRYGCTGVGFDIDRDMLTKAKANVNAAGLDHRIQLRHGDLFAQSLANFDMIVAYLFRAGCAKLQSKLDFELKATAVLVCVGFALPRWRPYWEHRTSAGLFVRLYLRPS